MKLFLLLLAICSLVYSKDRNDKPSKVVCYFASWTGENSGDTHFAIEDLNPNVCTHINFAFARLNQNKIEVSDSKNLIGKVNDLRKKNPHLTTLISLGGWGDGSTKYSEMVRSAANRQTFVHSVVEFLKAHDLDGLDLDWEFPGFSGVDGGDRQLGRAEDKQDYVTLLRELKEAFKPAGSLLTAAITSAKYNVDHAYDIAQVSQLLDFINLMTYDYHGPWSHATGHNAPLHAPTGANEEDKLSTIEFTVNYFLQHGADAKKLVLGIPLYGYYFQLSGTDHRVGAPVVKGTEGSTYGHICHMIKEAGWQLFYDETAQVPYAVHGTEWVTYDNLKSLGKKLEFITQKGLGGAMVWEVNGDDFKGQCGDGKYPMMKLMMKTLNKVDVHD